MRSVSLTRSSAASRTVRPPLARRAQNGQRGNLVDQRRGHRAFNHAARDFRSPHAQVADQLAAGLMDVETLIDAPIDTRKSSSAERVGFNPTP